MKLIETPLQGVFIVENFSHTDERGQFVKTFQEEQFRNAGLQTHWAESFFSTNPKGVIRGMHLQIGPAAHEKLVYCVQGSVLDVIVDLRPGSPSFKQFLGVELSLERPRSVYIPKGCAHGFCTTAEDGGTILYLTSTVHSPEYDTGIRYDSFGLEWPVESPVMSQRDLDLPPMEELLARLYFG